MSDVISYKHLALDWEPARRSSRLFNALLITIVVCLLGAAIAISFVKVPELTREQRVKIPERVAKFIAQKPRKVEPPKEIPKPPPVPVPPPEKRVTATETQSAQVSVTRRREDPADNKPLTQTQQRARTTAQQSGLLALAAEMEDMKDTRELSAQMRTRVTESTKATAATHKLNEVAAALTDAGNAVNEDKVIGEIKATDIQARKEQITTAATDKAKENAASTGGSGGRASEDVSLVFNKNKASLYALYERERRKNAALKGKVVFQLTIAPNGKVSSVKIVSSELHSPELEARILARIKTFVFSPTAGEPLTVNFPVEFVPS